MTKELKQIISDIKTAIVKFEELPPELTESESIIKHLTSAWLSVIQAKKEFIELKNNTTTG